jgi:putative glutamine amidotransferase
MAHIVSGCAGVLLPGSPADLDARRFGQQRNPHSAAPDPAREAADELLLEEALRLKKPVLGICYGCQSMNVWRKGSLDQHIAGTGVDHAPGREVHEAHGVSLAPGSRLASIVGAASGAELKVNSSHHQAVAVAGDGLEVVARSSADGIVEAIEDARSARFVVGVQWHPERTFGVQSASRALFAAFVAAAGDWDRRSVPGPAAHLPGTGRH